MRCYGSVRTTVEMDHSFQELEHKGTLGDFDLLPCGFVTFGIGPTVDREANLAWRDAEHLRIKVVVHTVRHEDHDISAFSLLIVKVQVAQVGVAYSQAQQVSKCRSLLAISPREMYRFLCRAPVDHRNLKRQ